MILEDIQLARPADVDLSDLTTARPTGPARWIGPDRLVIPMDAEPTAEEAEAIRVRLTSPNGTSDTETLRRQALAAFRANRAYLNLAAPTSAEVRDQVAALTRQVNALIRLTVER